MTDEQVAQGEPIAEKSSERKNTGDDNVVYVGTKPMPTELMVALIIPRI